VPINIPAVEEPAVVKRRTARRMKAAGMARRLG
jgi:hypothetical protein